MSTPCEQEPIIKNIHKTLERMDNALEGDRKERRASEHRLMDVLEKLANQGARIDNLEESVEDNHKDINILYERLRDVELVEAANGPATRQRLDNTLETLTGKLDDVGKRLDKLLGFYRLTTGKYAMWLYGAVGGMIILGFISDLYNHYDWMKSVYHFWRG